MDFATISLGDLIQSGAFVLLVVLFVRGDIFSKVAVDKILEHSMDSSKVMAVAITNGVKDAVKQGILEANDEMNGEKKTRT